MSSIFNTGSMYNIAVDVPKVHEARRIVQHYRYNYGESDDYLTPQGRYTWVYRAMLRTVGDIEEERCDS